MHCVERQQIPLDLGLTLHDYQRFYNYNIHKNRTQKKAFLENIKLNPKHLSE